MPDNNTLQPPIGSPDNSRDNEAIHPAEGDLPNVNRPIPESQQPIPRQDIITSPGSAPTGLPPNIHGPEQPKSSKSRIKRLLSKKSLTWLSIALIVGPILAFILLGMAFSGPDGGLVVVALGFFLLIPMALGLLLCVVLVSLFLLRKPKDAKKHPVIKVLAAMFIILVFGGAAWIAYSYVHYGNQTKKDIQDSTINQKQTLQLINNCQIDHLQQQAHEIDIYFNANDEPAGLDQANLSFYKTTTSNWTTLVNAANQASKKCGFVEADNQNTTYSWISLSDAQELLLSCQIGGVDNYDSSDAPTGSRTGIALVDYGNYKELDVTDDELPLLKATVNNAQQNCGIKGLNGIYSAYAQ